MMNSLNKHRPDPSKWLQTNSQEHEIKDSYRIASLSQRFSAAAGHSVFYGVVMLAIPFWLGHFLAESKAKPSTNAQALAYASADGIRLSEPAVAQTITRPDAQPELTPEDLLGGQKHLPPQTALELSQKQEFSESSLAGLPSRNVDGADLPTSPAVPLGSKPIDPLKEPEVYEELGEICFQKKDYQQAYRDLSQVAPLGRAKAQYLLARMYREGKGVQQDTGEAVKWFSQAVRRGYLPAYNELAELYRAGNGAPKDPVRAAKLFRIAAEHGDAAAQANLGNCLEFGDGIAKQESEAEAWYRRSAKQGCAAGQNLLGTLLHNHSNDIFQQILTKGEKHAESEREPLDKFVKAERYRQAAFKATAVKRSGFEIEGDAWWLLAAAQGYIPDQQRDYPVFNTNSSPQLTKDAQEQRAAARRIASAFVPRIESTNEWLTGAGPLPGLGDPNSSGTGFFISENGYLVTNFHVVEDAFQILVKYRGTNYPAHVVKVDMANDIALLKLSGTFTSVRIARSDPVKLGESVFTIGFPNPQLQGVQQKLTDGKISSLAGAHDDTRHFQISVPVQPGNSGGALLNSAGNVVGIVTARLSDRAALEASGALPQNVNYALKSSYLLSLLQSVSELAGKVKGPWPATERKFEDLVREAQEAAALILVY